MTDSNWNVDTNMTVHCIGCGTKSPCQRMPSPFCPSCAHDPVFKAYWRALFTTARAEEREACAKIADDIEQANIRESQEKISSRSAYVERSNGAEAVADAIRERGKQ